MNFIKKLFSNKTAETPSREEWVKTIQERTNQLWAFLDEALVYFDSKGCACAFPRYRQIVAIDCVDYAKNFYASETEGLISKSATYFDIEKDQPGSDAANEKWTCKKCGSIYHFGWQDFSIHVSRSTLKLVELKTSDIGAGVQKPIPLFVGLFGHTMPEKTEITPVGFEEFKTYLLAGNSTT